MKYTVSINEEKRSITVTLADGTQGVARCAPTDSFNINTGIELALERARVAKANTLKASIITKTNKPMSVMELVKALEAALPEGEMVVVGKGDKMTEAQKKMLRSLVGGCSCDGNCNCKGGEDDDAIYEDGYGDGYGDGYDDGIAENTQAYEELEAEYSALEADFNALGEDYNALEEELNDYKSVIRDIHIVLEDHEM